MKLALPILVLLLPAMAKANAAPMTAASPAAMRATTADGRQVVLKPSYVPASEFVPDMADANAAAALPPMAPDPRLAPAPDDGDARAVGASVNQFAPARAPLPPLPVLSAQGLSAPVMPAPVQPVPIALVPVAVPVAGWNWGAPVVAYGWNRSWNRGWGRPGWNGGWNGAWGGPVWGGGFNRGWNGGWNGGRGWGCRSTGSGALLGTVAGAVIGYGIADPWNRGTGAVLGGVVGGLAGSAIERSGRRC
jgi:hypothetical protein